MIFKMLVIEADSKNDSNNKCVPIRWKTHHIVEMFMEFLPNVVLDGSSKLTIYAMEKPEKEEKYTYSSYFHVSAYYLERDKIDKLKFLEEESGDECILHIIVDTLIDIVNRHNGDEAIIRIINETAMKVRENNFKLKKMIPKLSKKSDCGQFKASVYRCLCRDLGESWCVEIKSKMHDELYIEWLTKKPGYLDRRDMFMKVRWEDGKLIFSNKINKTIASISPKFC